MAPTRWSSLLTLLVAATPACDGCEAPPPPPVSASAPPPPKIVPARATAEAGQSNGRWTVADAAGRQVLEVAREKDVVTLKWPRGELVGRQEGGTRRYVDASNPSRTVAVATGGSVVVLRGPNGEVTWRVMLGTDSFRTWRGAETSEPSAVLEGGEMRRGGEVVGRVTRDGDQVVVASGEERYRGSGTSDAWALMLLDAEMADRAVLIAELLARGR